jgi:serine/threonine protein kinase
VYEVQALIAAGGMGEVYRGLDTRLNRLVAIKTLSADLAHDPAWRERLRREAQSVSRLNHPHICTLYDVGIENDIYYLVMEHMEGETLEARLARGPLPFAAALEYSIQIVDALDKAHRRGVVHRDVKPSNVMLTKSGAKVLDFGIATEMRSDGALLGATQAESAYTLTAKGTILGTPQYMSPEQLEGRPADPRTDIFAFGGLGYEMVTGKRAFVAASPARLVGAILTDDPPPIAEIAPAVPSQFVRTISRCLAKDPEDRWQTANDLLFQLRSIAADPTPIDGPRSQPVHSSRRVERAVWVAIVIASIAGMWWWAGNRGVPASAPVQGTAAVRFTLSPPADTAFASSQDVPLALSPDGRQIVYVAAGTDGIRRLWLRALDSEREQVLIGTDGANTPFWSPDSQWVGFFAGNSLKKIRLSSGIAQTVASQVSTYGGATWSVRDVILFPATTGGLLRISAQGGLATQQTKGQGHFWPQFLPDGEHFIYSAAPATVMVGALGSGPHRTLMKFPVRASALAYASGHLFYVQDRLLFARPFDQNRLAFSGDAVRVLEGVPVIGNGRAPFSVSAAGVLAYWPSSIGESAVLQWFERDGRTTPAVGSPTRYLGFALSPDARQLVFSRMDANGGADLWLRDLDRHSEAQLTYDAASFTPHWSPDGSRLLFTGPGPFPPPKMFVRDVTGAGAVTRVGSAALTPDFASSWSGDGGSIVSVRIDPVNRNDLWVHRTADASDIRLSINTPFNESHGKVSPDGRWLAYTTDESGREQVWLSSFPSGQIRRQASAAGGTAPQWGEGGKELFFLSLENQLMAASVVAGQSGVDIGRPKHLFRMPNLIGEGRLLMPTANNYLATSNGQRFLAAVSARDPNAPPISVIVNWPALVGRAGTKPSP